MEKKKEQVSLSPFAQKSGFGKDPRPQFDYTGRTIEYISEQGESTAIKILEEKKIGEGHWSSVYEVIALVGGHRRKRFVIKKIKPITSDRDMTNVADIFENAMKMYQKAKEAGLRVFPTYRASKARNSILMTAGHSEEWICIGTNSGSSKLEDFGEQPLDSSSNLESFIRAYFDELLLAGQKGIRVPSDSYFFFINTKDKKIDFRLGDTDSLTFADDIKNSSSLKENYQSITKKNIEDGWEHRVERLIKESITDSSSYELALKIYKEYLKKVS